MCACWGAAGIGKSLESMVDAQLADTAVAPNGTPADCQNGPCGLRKESLTKLGSCPVI
jgi:hypothetical protein